MKRIHNCIHKVFVLVSIAVVLTSLPSQRIYGQFWEQTAGPYGGHVWCVFASQRDIVYTALATRLYKSTNAGANWTLTTMPSRYVLKIIEDDSSDLYAATDGGIYKSTDAGNQWLAASQGLPLTGIFSITRSPLTQTLFAGGGGVLFRSTNAGASWSRSDSGLGQHQILHLQAASSGSIYAGTYGGAFRSKDDGMHWDSLDLPSLSVGAVHCKSSGGVFVSFVGTNLARVFRSTDDGASWQLKADSLPSYAGVYSFAADQGGYIYAGTSIGAIYGSSNNGDTWHLRADLNGGAIYSLAVSPYGGIYAGTEVSVFRSVGLGWQDMGFGLPHTNTTSIAFSQHGLGYAAVSTGGVFRTADNGYSWVSVSNGLRFRSFVSIRISESGIVFLGSIGGAFRSDDNGASWINLTSGNTFPLATYGFAFNSSGTLFAAANNGLYRSSNAGNKWVRVDSALATHWFTNIVASNDARMFAGSDSGMFWSADNGSSWNRIPSIPSTARITALCANSSGHIFGGSTSGTVFRSFDNGTSWETTQVGTNRPIEELTINPLSHLFAATATGVYRTLNNGDSWLPINSGLTTLSILSLSLNPSGFLLAGTQGWGVFRSRQSTTAMEEGTLAFANTPILSQNYPNPFNPSTRIRFQIPSSGEVVLKVYDLLSREVTTLVNERKPPGTYEIDFDGSGLASGLYLYRLKAGSFVETKKLVLLR